MADAIRIKVDGLQELGVAFGNLKQDMQLKVSRAVTNAMAQVVKKAAAQKAPLAPGPYQVQARKGDAPITVEAGNVRKKVSVKYLGTKTGKTSEHIVFVKGKRKDGYASRIGSFAEFGTVHEAPRPFMRPALAENTGQAIEAGKKRLQARIEKANKNGGRS